MESLIEPTLCLKYVECPTATQKSSRRLALKSSGKSRARGLRGFTNARKSHMNCQNAPRLQSVSGGCLRQRTSSRL